MKNFILSILLIHFTVAVNAANYYFSSSSGDDSRSSSQAQNSSTPWRTVGKLNSVMYLLKPGDQVLFKRNETFYGALTVTASGSSGQPITFGDYGTGEKPVITGLSTLGGWIQSRSNVWEASLSPASGNTSIVVMNNMPQAIGRYPNRSASNGGYLNIDSHSGPTYISCSQLNSSINWVGGDIVIRKNRWTIDRSRITYQAGTGLGFDIGSTADISDNYGLFIVNHPSTLDQNGEWYYDKNRKKLQMYFGSNNPNSYAVKASTVETLVTIDKFESYLTFVNLTFEGANSYTFNITNSNNITINFCNINYTGNNAVQALSTDYFTLSNSAINYTNNNALNLYWNCNHIFVTGNIIKNTGIFPGMAQNGISAHKGIIMRGNSNLVQYNEVDSTGNSAIAFEGDYSTVQNNFVNTFGFVVDDCGGIYTGQGTGDFTQYHSKNINNNIVINGIGAVDGTNNRSYLPTHGIYLDDNTNHVTVSGNTVANCTQSGIFSHNATYANITNNTMYNNGQEQFLVVRSYNPISYVTATSNIMFAKTVDQLATRMESYYGYNNINEMGNITNNYHCRPIDNNYMFYYMYLQNGTYYPSYQTLAGWQNTLGLDANSKTSPATFPSFSYSGASGVNMFTNGSFDQNINNVGSFSSIGDVSTSWNSSKLDGGTLQISAKAYSSSNNFNLTFPTSNSVTAGKGYLLSFTLQGASGGKPVVVYLRDQDYPYSDLTSRFIIPAPNSRTNYQFGFIANASKRAAIEIDETQPNGTTWIDNLNLQSATITPTNPDNYIVFYYNVGFNSKQFSLPGGTYYDAKGATYSGTVTVPSYGSAVLFKAGTQSMAQTTTLAQAINAQASLKIVTATTAADLIWQVDNQSSDAVAYEVERSADTSNFITVGSASVKANADSAITSVAYQFTDAQPLGGKNYYRIKQRDAKGNYVYSKVMMVNNISFKLNPNPARDVVHLQFDQAVNAEDHLGKEIVIRNAAGAVSQTVQMPATSSLNRVDINVGSLRPGLYILSITADGKAISRTFLKQ